MIQTRFNFIYTLSDAVPGQRFGITLLTCDLHQVPGVNEIVNIDGNPFRVFSRSWAIGEPDDQLRRRQFAYVEVQKASTFTFKLGDREF